MTNNNMEDNYDDFLNGHDESNFYLLEEEIDVKIQNKYFKQSRHESELIDEEEVLNKADLLHNDEIDVEDKKQILAQLATVTDIKAYRILEKEYGQFEDEELNLWSILAYNEARMILNGSLKDEQQIFISTGLGGKDSKFRYFVVLFPHDDLETFSNFHREFVTKEVDFTLQRNGGNLETTIEVTNEYMSFKVLIPIKADIRKLFKKVLDNCNQLSPFVNDKFILTNMEEMDEVEINRFLETAGDDENEIENSITSLN